MKLQILYYLLLKGLLTVINRNQKILKIKYGLTQTLEEKENSSQIMPGYLPNIRMIDKLEITFLN